MALSIGAKGFVMAKKDEQKASELGRVKFRYADAERFFDLDVDNIKNETGVVDGLKSIASALASRTIAIAPNRALVAKATNGSPNGVAAAPPVAEEPETPEQDLLAPEEEETVPAAANSNGKSTPKQRKVREPKFLTAIDLTAATVKLSDFFKQKDPQNIFEKYLVIAVWFKEQMATEEFDVNHIYTGFDHMGLRAQIPADPGQPLRYLKMKNLVEQPSRGKYKVTWNGSSAVAKMPEKK
jgi:hypothetical protein